MLKRFLVLLAGLSLLLASPAHAAAWTSSEPDDMWFDRGYIVHNNMWNASGYKVSQTVRANSYKRWQVTATADNRARDGAVKTFPNVHRDYHDWNTGHEPRVRAFKKIRSSFAGRGPRVGIYNVGYDVWLNGVPGDHEIMIWTENYRQVPAGRVVARGLRWSNRTWRLYATSDNGYLALVPGRSKFKGTLPIRSMLGYLIRQGRVPGNATLGQICYGVEIVSTGGKPATFKFTDFSISTARR